MNTSATVRLCGVNAPPDRSLARVDPQRDVASS
jgi:hypothetical protein